MIGVINRKRTLSRLLFIYLLYFLWCLALYLKFTAMVSRATRTDTRTSDESRQDKARKVKLYTVERPLAT